MKIVVTLLILCYLLGSPAAYMSKSKCQFGGRFDLEINKNGNVLSN